VEAAATASTDEDNAVNGTLTATDADGDALTFSLETAPAEGSVTVNADGSYEYNPGSDFDDLAAGESRDVTFDYSVDDGNGGTTTETVTITVNGTNDGPVAEAATASTDEDNAVSGTLTATDAEGDALTFSLETAPTEGSVTVNADGSYDFDPGSDFDDLAAGESRDVTFEYTVDDGNGGTSTETATVTVNGVDDAPEPGTLFSESFSSGSSFTASEGSNVNSGSHGASGGGYTFDGTTDGSSSDGAVTLTSSEIDIEGHTDLALNIDISHSGGLEAGGSVADYLNVYVVVDGVRQQVVDVDGSASEDGSISVTVTGLPEGSVATIEIEAKTTLAGETYTVNSVSLESGVESTPETEGLQSFSGFFGGENDDFLVGTSSGEDLRGLAGDDTISASSGNDTIDGGSGNDSVRAGSGDDTIEGGSGNDTLRAEGGDDTVSGGDGADIIYGESGNDQIDAGSGNDGIAAGSGNDIVDGGTENDLIYGESGNDTLIGGAGDDTLSGGSGDDLFVFGADDGNDIVSGGSGWTDTIDLSDNSASGQSWTITLDDGSEITSQNDNYLDLTEDASGTITFDDGTQIDFTGIEKVTW
jgi:VCBS repeat-containing protein